MITGLRVVGDILNFLAMPVNDKYPFGALVNKQLFVFSMLVGLSEGWVLFFGGNSEVQVFIFCYRVCSGA